MKRFLVVTAWALVSILVTSSLAQPGDGYVGIYSDSLGITPCASVPPTTAATLYVIAKTAGASASGITGAEFRIEVTNPTGWYLSYTAPGAANIVMGNPIDTDPDPNAGGGLNLGFPACQVPSGTGQVRLGTLSVFNASGGPTNRLVKRHSTPSNPGFACALFVKCDDPYYSKVSMTSAAPDSCTLGAQKAALTTAGDPTVFTASLNEAGGDSGEPPSDPDREVLALFVPGIIQLPPGATYATLASTTVTSPAVESVLESHSVESIAKAFPDFVPADAIAMGRTGQIVRLQDLSEIYKFLLPVGGNPTNLAQDLEALIDEVGYAEPNGGATSFCVLDMGFPNQWYLENAGLSGCQPDADIDFCGAYAITQGDTATTIAIIDVGLVYQTHPDLSGKVSGASGATGHSTMVAGIAAAYTNNSSIGIAGVNSRARIFSTSIVSTLQGIAAVVRQAADSAGAEVLNNSWGLDQADPNQTVRGAFRDAYMLDRVAVAAMGNEGSLTPRYPAAYDQGIIAVGNTDCRDQRAEDSNMGLHIDVAAPGVNIYSTAPGGYGYDSGTSFSAPQVSGLAGLLLALNPGLHNDDVEQLIRLSADDVNHDVLPGFDVELGMGRINAHRALQLLQDPHELYQETAGGGSAVDSTGQYTLWFHVPPDGSPARNFSVRRFEMHKSVTFPVTFDSIPDVWGRGALNATTGYSHDYYVGTPPRAKNWNMAWCDTVGGTVTPRGCTLRTFVYEVKSFPGLEPIGWWPAHPDSVQFGYSVLGTATLTDASSDRAGSITLAPRLWSANPLRRGATIAVAIPRAGTVRIDLFDVAGRRVRVLQDGRLSEGSHELRWNGLSDKGSSLAAGLYFVRLETVAGVVTRKFVVLE